MLERQILWDGGSTIEKDIIWYLGYISDEAKMI
jgi:hypothetical protein